MLCQCMSVARNGQAGGNPVSAAIRQALSGPLLVGAGEKRPGEELAVFVLVEPSAERREARG